MLQLSDLFYSPVVLVWSGISAESLMLAIRNGTLCRPWKTIRWCRRIWSEQMYDMVVTSSSYSASEQTNK